MEVFGCLAGICKDQLCQNGDNKSGHSGSHPVTLRIVQLTLSPAVLPSRSQSLHLSLLVSQTVGNYDLTQDHWTDTDPLFLKSKDGLIAKISEKKMSCRL